MRTITTLSFSVFAILIAGVCTSRSVFVVPPPRLSRSSTLQSSDTPTEITLCRLLKDPGAYNQKLVKISAFFSHGFEDSAIYDPTCDSRFRVWYEYGGKNVTGTMYCCGLTNARTRPKQITVEKIPIPLVVDSKFKQFDDLLQKRGGSVRRATVVGRFFSGTKSKGAQGEDWWNGYGHMGCCSLLMVQQVLDVDPHDRADLDYRPAPDQPALKAGCGYKNLLSLDLFQSHLKAQASADNGEQEWAFTDPHRVASEALSSMLQNKIDGSYLKLIRQTQGRMVYQWIPGSKEAAYVIVVSKPYELSVYAKTDKVAWVVIGAYRSSCGNQN
jgi:hypothetical protein